VARPRGVLVVLGADPRIPRMRSMRPSRGVVAWLALAMAAACTGRNYPGTAGPRYAGAPPIDPATGATGATGARADTLRVATFNVRYAIEVDSAIAVLRAEPALRGADLVLLQEMDADGTRRVAEALGMWYAYYPAIYRRPTRRDFGNAVLSRWPIVEDAKLVLPHVSRYARTQRIATAATIRVGNAPGDSGLVRVYSAHLGTVLDVSARSRRDQLRAILADAARWPRVVVGGDMNSADVGRAAREAGYAWPTERLAPTTPRGERLDHVFFRGLAPRAADAAGVVTAIRGASDHFAVWAVAALR
jgi:endonuclease/exonuclease/phosphatase family metal-dependent hydrolase